MRSTIRNALLATLVLSASVSAGGCSAASIVSLYSLRSGGGGDDRGSDKGRKANPGPEPRPQAPQASGLQRTGAQGGGGPLTRVDVEIAKDKQVEVYASLPPQGIEVIEEPAAGGGKRTVIRPVPRVLQGACEDFSSAYDYQSGHRYRTRLTRGDRRWDLDLIPPFVAPTCAVAGHAVGCGCGSRDLLDLAEGK